MRNTTFHRVTMPNLSVRIQRDVLVEAGLNARPAFARAGLDESIASQIGAVITGDQELRFQRGFVDLTANRPDLWIKLGKRYTLPTLSVRGLAMITAPTLAKWVDTVISGVDLYYAFIDFRPLTNSEGRLIGLEQDFSNTPAELVDLSICRDFMSTVSTLNYLWQSPFPLTQVDLPLDEVPAELQAAVAVPIRTRQPVTRFIWDASLSTQPLPLGNDLLFQEYSCKAATQLREFRLDGDLSEHIVSLLLKSRQQHLDLHEIAALLNTSVRTLQRRLDKLGVSFRDLKEKARFEEAQALLRETSLPISEIAWRLGYNEAASFSSAFKRWCNNVPSAYRSDRLSRQDGAH